MYYKGTPRGFIPTGNGYTKLHSKNWKCPTLYFFSANVSKEDEGFINQQGVHELFADILFADPSEWDEDSSSMVRVK